MKFVLGGGVIWGLVHSGMLDPSLLLKAFVKHPWLCGLGFLINLGFVVFVGWLRWFLVIRLAGLTVSAWRSFKLQMIGLFFNSLVPGGNGGDIIKGYYLFKEHKAGSQGLALTSIAMDRIVGTYGLLCLGMLMTASNYPLWKDSALLGWTSFFYAGIFLAFTALVAFFLSPFSPRLLAHPRLGRLPGGKVIASLANSLLVYRRRPFGLLLVLAVDFIVNAGLVVLYFVFAKALSLQIPFLVQGFVVPTMTMINGLPISPSGVGVGEAAGEMIYRQVGVLHGGSEIIALVHICVIATSLLGAPFYFFFKGEKKTAPKNEI